jgi:hypothetical protein
MNTTKKKRAYGKLRDIVERLGGKMEFERQGHRHGAWRILLEGKAAVIEAEGRRTFPKLDALYVPAVADPKTWDDYRDELVPDAQKRLCDLLA